MSLSAMGFPLKRLADDVPHFVSLLTDFLPGECWRVCRQIEHLKKGPIKSDQIFLDESVSGSDVIVHRKLEQGTNGILGVE